MSSANRACSSRRTVVPVNVEGPTASGPSTVTLNLGAAFRSGRLTALTTASAAGLAATTDITLGGSQLGPHAAFPPPRSAPVQVEHRTATVTVPAGGAEIIQFGRRPVRQKRRPGGGVGDFWGEPRP